MPKKPKQKAQRATKTHQANLTLDGSEIGFVFSMPTGEEALAATRGDLGDVLSLLNRHVDALAINGKSYPIPARAPLDAIVAIATHIFSGGVTGE